MNKRNFALIFIIIAGEAVFMLPFLIPRLYRPLLLEAWGLTNTDIGIAFSAYGFSAMISYVIGGPFADKYSPRKLMAISLFATSLAGLVLVFFPNRSTLISTYFFFGISTILLMWGALMKVTHVTGGQEKRSTAMGILDGGRGLIAALISSLLVVIISLLYTDIGTSSDKTQVVQVIYLITILFTFSIAVAIWFSLKGFEANETEKRDWSFQKVKVILEDMKVWLLGLIILSAYCGYKSVDNYSVYLVDIHKLSLKDSSIFTSIIFWLRPISAFATGLIVDKFHAKNHAGRFLSIFYFLFIGSLLQFYLASEISSHYLIIFFTILVSAALAYSLRAVYFSVFGDLNIPDSLVGTTVGIVSLVGYLPDMFFGAFTGHLIDTYPGAQGYNYTFMFTGSALLMGAIASFLIYKVAKLK